MTDCVGKTGTGKSWLLRTLIAQDLRSNRSCIVIDPHGDLARSANALVPDERRSRDCAVFVDECWTFSTLSLASMLSELRKYGVGMVLAHQHLAQLDKQVRDAVFGNVGTIIAFRVGAADASNLAREFSPIFGPDDFLSLPRYHVYLRLQVNGEASRPFSATTLSSLASIDIS